MTNTTNGTITLPNGRPAAGLTVRAYHKSLRTETILGADTTDAHGKFSMEFTASPPLNLVVKVFNPKARTPLVESAPRLKAGPKETFDFTVPTNKFKGMSEFTRLQTFLSPHLEGLTIEQIRKDQIDLLATNAGLEQEFVARFYSAHTLNRAEQMMPEVFFALLSSGLSDDGNELFYLPLPEFNHGLQQAVENHIIPALSAMALSAMGRLYLSKSISKRLLEPLYERGTSIQSVWQIARLTSSQQQQAVQLWLEHRHAPDAFWDAVSSDGLLAPLAGRMRLLTELNNLTLGNTPLLTRLASLKHITSLGVVAGWTREDWIREINHTTVGGHVPDMVPGLKPADKLQNYAAYLSRMLETLLPHAAVAGRLFRDPAVPSLKKQQYQLFFRNNPGFDFSNTTPAIWLEKNPRALYGIRGQAEFKEGLFTLSRLFRLAPEVDRYAVIQKLRDAGIVSAGQIARMGYSAFKKSVALEELHLSTVGNNARRITLSNGNLLAIQSDYSGLPWVMRFDITHDAVWQSVFGAEDFCECAHCRSLYGPAAYFADLLNFLTHRALPAPVTVVRNGQTRVLNTAFDVLDDRRPDLKNILLNCENAHTPLPYIDLVNEVLECLVDHNTPDHSPAYQTTLEAEQLSTDPENLSVAAYTKLARQNDWKWPWSLPFDLWTESGRAYIAQSGIHTADWVEAANLNTEIQQGVEAHWLAEAGLTPEVARLVIANDYSSGETEYWLLRAVSESGPGPLLPVTGNTHPMPRVLRSMQVSFDEFREILATEFVNPGGTWEVNYGPDCRLENATLKFTGTRAKKLYQFTRLLKHLRLSVSTLDNLLRGMNATEVDANTLTGIGVMMRFARIFRMDVSEVAGWFLPENTGDSLPERLSLSLAGISTLETAWVLNAAQPEGAWKLFRNWTILQADGWEAQEAIAYLMEGKTAEGFPEEKRKQTLHAIREARWKFENTAGESGAPLTSRQVIIQTVSSQLKLDRKVLEVLADDYAGDLWAPFEATTFWKPDDQQLTGAPGEILPEEDLNLQTFSAQDERLILLHKAALIVNRNAYLTPDHWASLIRKGWFSIQTLEANNVAGKLVGLAMINQAVPFVKESEETGNLVEVMGSGGVSGINELLEWELAESILTDAGISNLSNPEFIQKLLSLKRFAGHLDIADRNELMTFSQLVFSQSDAEKVKEKLKSRYTEKAWVKTGTEIREGLRERQRDALLAFVTAHSNASDGDDLYAHLLLDVEMSACTLTSRIKLALSGVQLFVQRCLMNLEPHVDLSTLSEDEDESAEWGEWEWRKNYRVWEANRKIFLYPENWLEPDWRDDRTPIFRELENELRQSDLTAETSETAYLNYLHKLEAISNLEIVAICDGARKQTGTVNEYFIFGRTHSQPKELYFRKYIREPESFTPWEKVEVDFEGDHLVPVFRNGRLFLFWPIFQEKQERGSKVRDTYSEPEKFWVIRLGWSEYRGNSWMAKRMSEAVLSTFYYPDYYQKKESLEGLLFLSHPSIENPHQQEFLFVHETSGLHYEGSTLQNEYFVFDFDNQKATSGKLEGINFISYYHELAQDLTGKRLGQHLKKSFRFDQGLVINSLIGESVPENSIILSPSWSVLNGRTTVRANIYNRPFLISDNQSGYLVFQRHKKYFFLPFNHPMVPEIRTVIGDHFSNGNFLQEFAAIQESERALFATQYDFGPSIENLGNVPVAQIEFESNQAYAQYNWELFFHIPVHIANKFRQEQKFEAALKWFQFVFDPNAREGEAPLKFWNFKPFRDLFSEPGADQYRNIWDLFRAWHDEDVDESVREELDRQVGEWEQNAFSPHAVARLRIVAYMKWTVMRYIDTLVEWADQLFRRDSIESLNEATQLYMLAWNMLGKRPDKLPPRKVRDLAFKDFDQGLDPLSNRMVALEDRQPTLPDRFKGNSLNMIQPIQPERIDDLLKPDRIYSGEKPGRRGETDLVSQAFYFCIPPNEKLLGYWALLADRFFKLRNCLNIEGVYRQLPLYEPPIDPALLIRAKQAGISIADALSAAYQGRAHYRFTYLLARAIDYANDVRAFGNALLTAMEKRDAEKVSLLRAEHEQNMLESILDQRQRQLDEAENQVAIMQGSQQMAETRFEYFDGKERRNEDEKEQEKLQTQANTLQAISQSIMLAAKGMMLIPQIDAGVSGWGGHFTNNTGGVTMANMSEKAADAFALAGSILGIQASQLGMKASFDRRYEEWRHQAEMARMEVKQAGKQILAAEIRREIAQYELRNHEQQMEQGRAQYDLLQTKFSNLELYDWMVDQLRILYFQSYQMAFDMAKKAENALQNELTGLSSRTFIRFGYWNDLRAGLLSGEKLHHDLKRMEMAWMEENKRLHEVTQTFSLAMIDPAGLIALRKNGACTFQIPEELLIWAFPTHKNRKIKSVSLTIPAVTGPFTGIHCTLGHGTHSIATSTGQNDTGLFQFNFNDERYLPFEGSEPHGQWTIDMGWKDENYRPFDYDTITDVLLQVSYSAENGGTDRSDEVKTFLRNGRNLKRFFSLRNEFPADWYEAKDSQENLKVTLEKEMLPFVAQGTGVEVKGITFWKVPLASEAGSVHQQSNLQFIDGKLELDLAGVVPDENLEDVLLVLEYEVQ